MVLMMMMIFVMGRVWWDNFLAMSKCDIHGKTENKNILLNLNHVKWVAMRKFGQQHPVDDMNFISPWLPVLFRDKLHVACCLEIH